LREGGRVVFIFSGVDLKERGRRGSKIGREIQEMEEGREGGRKRRRRRRRRTTQPKPCM
jgi:hypothetical protein